MSEFFSVREVADRLGVRAHVVLAHIASGSLRAFDVSTSGHRPHWRIASEDVEGFFLRRTHQAAPRRRRRKRTDLNENKHF